MRVTHIDHYNIRLRPSELAALEARLAQARTAAELSSRELERATRLHQTAVVSDDDFDRGFYPS